MVLDNNHFIVYFLKVQMCDKKFWFNFRLNWTDQRVTVVTTLGLWVGSWSGFVTTFSVKGQVTRYLGTTSIVITKIVRQSKIRHVNSPTLRKNTSIIRHAYIDTIIWNIIIKILNPGNSNDPTKKNNDLFYSFERHFQPILEASKMSKNLSRHIERGEEEDTPVSKIDQKVSRISSIRLAA